MNRDKIVGMVRDIADKTKIDPFEYGEDGQLTDDSFLTLTVAELEQYTKAVVLECVGFAKLAVLSEGNMDFIKHNFGIDLPEDNQETTDDDWYRAIK